LPEIRVSPKTVRIWKPFSGNRTAESIVGSGDGVVHLVDLEDLWLRLPPFCFRALKHRVVRHLVKIFNRLPHVNDHYPIVASRTGVGYSLRLIARNRVL
jgi:hypothetical protein